MRVRALTAFETPPAHIAQILPDFTEETFEKHRNMESNCHWVLGDGGKERAQVRATAVVELGAKP